MSSDDLAPLRLQSAPQDLICRPRNLGKPGIYLPPACNLCSYPLIDRNRRHSLLWRLSLSKKPTSKLPSAAFAPTAEVRYDDIRSSPSSMRLYALRFFSRLLGVAPCRSQLLCSASFRTVNTADTCGHFT
jgi:hypothetical protein